MGTIERRRPALKRTHLIRLLLNFSIILFLCSPLTVSAEKSVPSVLVAPFKIHSEKDLSFLNSGMTDMIVSRLGRSVKVLQPDTAKPLENRASAIQAGRDMGADYVVYGSLTLFGESASTNGQLVDIKTGEPAVVFNKFSQNSGDVLMHINSFSTQIFDFFNSEKTTASTTVPVVESAKIPPSEPAAGIVVAPVPTVKTTPSPEAATSSVAATASPETTTPSKTAVSSTESKAAPVWRSHPFSGTVTAMATGDVDGDGQMELVSIMDNTIQLHRFTEGRLVQLFKYESQKHYKILSVDAADINGNGPAEIFVTRLGNNDRLDSLVLEWVGEGLIPIEEGARWYFRVINDFQQQKLLIGQRQGSPSAIDTGGMYQYRHFLPGIMRLEWQGGGYTSTKRLSRESDMDLYRYATGDVFGDGKPHIVSFSSSDKLRIKDSSGKTMWSGSEALGGNPLYLTAPSDTDRKSKDRTYLAQRILVADIDQDGKSEVITVKNRDFTSGVITRARNYTKGRMMAFSWSGINMKTVWYGEEISGYISDFSVDDLDGDGRVEAIYVLVAGGGFMGKGSSYVVSENIKLSN